VGGIGTDEPCTATTSDIDGLVDLGISLEELVAMNPGPRELGLPSGTNDYGSGFVDNFEFEEHWPAGCEAAKVLGRVTGRESYALSLVGEDLLTRGERVMTHIFQTEAGAAAYFDWLPTSPTPACLSCWTPDTIKPVETTQYTVEPIVLVADEGVLVHMVTEESNDYMALARVGRIVTEVGSFFPQSASGTADRAQAARALLRKAVSIQGQASAAHGAYDANQQMSAPLPREELGDYADALTWDLCCAGGRANWEYVELSGDPEMARAIVDAGRLVGFAAHYGWTPTVSTGISVFPDERRAADALEQAKVGKGERFDVTGVDGAVGLRSRITSDGDEESAIEDRVMFQHGSALASVLVRQPDTDNATPVDIAEIATAFADRLDVVLGPE
jgi:hypothetical protein